MNTSKTLKSQKNSHKRNSRSENSRQAPTMAAVGGKNSGDGGSGCGLP